jgi:hypothetical protein
LPPSGTHGEGSEKPISNESTGNLRTDHQDRDLVENQTLMTGLLSMIEFDPSLARPVHRGNCVKWSKCSVEGWRERDQMELKRLIILAFALLQGGLGIFLLSHFLFQATGRRKSHTSDRPKG